MNTKYQQITKIQTTENKEEIPMNTPVSRFVHGNIYERFTCLIVVCSLVASLFLPAFVPAGQASTNEIQQVNHLGMFQEGTDTCIIGYEAGQLTVDNTEGNRATQGCIIDYSGFPTVRVKVENLHGFWTEIKVFYNYNVGVVPANGWATAEVIPPDAWAEYDLTFDNESGSFIQFFVNAGRSEDGINQSA